MIEKTNTKAILAESLLELARIKPLNKITISNIVNNCNLSRETFYHHFSDKNDLISWIYVNYVSVVSKQEIGKYNLESIYIAGLSFFEKNYNFIKQAMDDNNQNSLKETLFQTTLNDILEYYMNNNIDINFSVQDNLELRLYIHGSIGLVDEWVQNHFQPDVVEIGKTILKAMPPQLKEVLDSYYKDLQ